MENLTELIAQTEQRIRGLSKSYVKAVLQPLYPVVIRLCAPEDAQEDIIRRLRSGLHKYWSDLADDVAIHGVTAGIAAEAADFDSRLNTDVRSLLQSRQRFQNMAIILYFDIVQTAAFDSLEQFQQYYQRYLAYEYDENHSINRMMFVIHDRPVNDPDRRKTAKEILEYLKTECAPKQSVTVLSSQLYGGAELAPEDDSRYEAIATLISLTDIESQPNFFAKLFHVGNPAILTLGRVYHEKPFRLIAVFTVDALIRHIVSKFSGANAEAVSGDDLKRVFCPQTRFDLLEPYYDAAKSVLPKEDCLHWLPFRDTDGTPPDDLAQIWQIFFEENFVSRMQEKADEQYEQIRAQFLNQLMQQFTHQQLAYLNHHPDIMESFWDSMRSGTVTLSAPDYRKAAAAVRSLYIDRVVSRLKTDIHRILESANTMSIALEQLESRMHDIVFSASANDRMAESVKRYYDSAVVRPYIEQHWNQIRMDFSLVQSNAGDTRAQLLAILEKYVNEIIRSESSFRASFEDELQQRMTNDGLNDQLTVQSSRAVTTVTDYIMGTGLRQVYLPDLMPEELLEVYLIPAEAKYLDIVRRRLQETDAIQTITANEYMERIALLRA